MRITPPLYDVKIKVSSRYQIFTAGKGVLKLKKPSVSGGILGKRAGGIEPP